MMEHLATGMAASRLFKDLQNQNRSIGPRELGEILMTEFPEISPAACISINRWSGVGSVKIADEDLDAVIAYLLKEAGYGA